MTFKEGIVHWGYQYDMTMEEIRDLAHCSLGFTVYTRFISNYREFGQVRNTLTRRMGLLSTLVTDGERIVFFNVHNNMFDPMQQGDGIG